MEIKEIPYFKGFYCSSCGSVFFGSKKLPIRLGGYKKRYFRVQINRKDYFVHRLVLQTFAGEAPHGFQACHNNGNPKAKDIMTISRIVIVPEFQGFGIGIKFMNLISELYKSDRIRITTSLKPFMIALNKSKEWKCVRSGRAETNSKSGLLHTKNSGSSNRITATFQYNKIKHSGEK